MDVTRVVSPIKVIRCVFFARNELFRVEELSVGPSPDLIDDGWFEIDKYDSCGILRVKNILGRSEAATTVGHMASYFKKVVSSNAQGVQQARAMGPNPNVGSGSSNSSTSGRGPKNGGHIQPPLRGTPDASYTSTGVTVKPAEASVQKSTPGLPKAPQSKTTSLGFATIGPSTNVKGPADSKQFPLQFGSISPGVINGMQVWHRLNVVNQLVRSLISKIFLPITFALTKPLTSSMTCAMQPGR